MVPCRVWVTSGPGGGADSVIGPEGLGCVVQHLTVVILGGSLSLKNALESCDVK